MVCLNGIRMVNKKGQQLVGEGIASWILWIFLILLGLTAIGSVLWKYLVG